MVNRNFENIKVGDTVIRYANRRKDLQTVKRITKTCFDLGDGWLYNKKDGDARGNKSIWEIRYCINATEEEINEVREEKRKSSLYEEIKSKIKRVKFSSMDIKSLEDFSNMLDKWIG